MKRGSALQAVVRQVKFALATTLVTAATAVAAHAGTMSVAHAGAQIEVPSNPKKTVVVDLPLLDIMGALDIPVAAVSSGRFEGSLAQYGDDSIPKVGSMFEPDLDAIRAIDPDLIISGRRGTKAFHAVAEVAPAINLAFDPQNLLESVMETTRTLAAIYEYHRQGGAHCSNYPAVLSRQLARAGKAVLNQQAQRRRQDQVVNGAGQVGAGHDGDRHYCQ